MASCFKLVVCAGDENDDFHQERLSTVAAVNERTCLSDKRRWSFRRRSSSQRVIMHTVVTNTDRDSMDFCTQPTAIENSSPEHLKNEETDLSMNANPTGASGDQIGVNADVEESSVTLIQTAVRRLWAQRELAKLKMVVKIQAAVRGHLVRRNAVGSLHCIQEILKLQALVHARYADADSSSTSAMSTSHCHVILEKLLTNSFALKLMKSAPNPKHLNIKCNPSSSCPAWLWMERWMSLASPTMDRPVINVEQEQKTNENGKLSHEKDQQFSENNETFGTMLTTDGPKFFGGSECGIGTELSMTSALICSNGSYNELPNRKEIKDGEISSHDKSTEKHDPDEKKFEDAKADEKIGKKKKLKGTKTDARGQKNLQLSSSSVKDSPRNLDISPGSQGTPSSQLVTKSGNGSGSAKNSESCKSKDSLSSVKKSSLSSARDCGASDSEQLQQKVDRRRSSLGSDISDLFVLKTTDIDGSDSLPSYMKATVSAKARVFASNSPRLSPDVLEKDIIITKRHSLPVANVKQISPKLMQHSKGNGNYEQGRKWQK